MTTVQAGASASAFGYDGSGNQIESPRGKLAYNSFNLPILLTPPGTAATTTFRYDALGYRIEKSQAGGDSVRNIGGLYERRKGPSGDLDLFSVRVGKRVVAQVAWAAPGAAAQTYYLLNDSLGSVDAVLDAAGTVVDFLKYGPFGDRVQRLDLGQPAPQPVSPVRIGFTGHRHDDELGLVDMRGRVYDPRLAKFLTPDPMVRPQFDGQSFNRYAYARNNPLAYVDPSGLQAVTTVTFSDAEGITIIGGTAVTFSDKEAGVIIGQANRPVTNIVFTDAESATAGGHIVGHVGGAKVADDQGTRDAPPPTAQPPIMTPPPAANTVNPLKAQAAERYRSAYVQMKARGIEPPTYTVPGNTWKAAMEATVDWLFEWGQDSSRFDANDPQVTDMKDAPKVNEARAFFLAKNRAHMAKGEPLEAVTNFSGSFGLSGLVKAGTDPTEQFVGSYRVDIAPNPDGSVTFTLSNTTSMKSFLYGLGPAYPRGGSGGVGGNQTQTYTWTELLIRDF